MNLTAAVIGEGFVARYLDFVSVHEAPPSYHLACLMARFSAALELRMGIDRGYADPMRANLYCLLLGPPASRKTHGMRIVNSIFRECGFPVDHLGDDATDEAIVADMQEKEEDGFSPACLVVCEEFKTFLSRKDYLQDLPEWLCKIYDGGPIRRGRRKHGSRTQDSFLSIIGGATPNGLKEINSKIFGSGLASRLWIVAEKGKAHWVWRPNFNGQRRRDLVQELKGILQQLIARGAFVFDLGREANEEFERWYLGPHRLFVETADEKVESWAGRRHDHAVKAGVLLHLLDGGRPETLGVEGARRGIAFVEAMEPGMFEAYGLMGSTQWGVSWQRILALVEKKKELQMRHLMAGVSKIVEPPSQMREAIQALVASGFVRVEGVGGKALVIWKGEEE